MAPEIRSVYHDRSQLKLGARSSRLVARSSLIRRSARDDRRGLTLAKRGHFGCNVCAIITCFLKLSTMFSSSRTSVGFFASVMVSILSCSLSRA